MDSFKSASNARISSESEFSDNEENSFYEGPQLKKASNKCPNCSASFVSLKSYQRHLRSHLSYSAFECKVCLLSFHDRAEYLSHKKVEKERLKKKCSYVCSSCQRSFVKLTSYNRHKQKHRSPPYQCPICKEVFRSYSSRSRHIKNHVIRCTVCGICFHDYSDYKDHIISEHRRKNSNAQSEPVPCVEGISSYELQKKIQSPKRIYEDKNFSCFVCEQKFSSEKLLATHVKAHRLFICSQCPCFFNGLAFLKKHELTHREKPQPSVQKNTFMGIGNSFVNSSKSVSIITNVSVFSTDTLDQDDTPALDFDYLLHIIWLERFTKNITSLDLPLSTKMSEKLSHIISLLHKQLTYPKGLVDVKKNNALLTGILAVLSEVSTKHFITLSELKE